MKHRLLKLLGLAIICSAVVVSCRKDAFVDEDNELGDGGKTIVKVLEGPKNELFFSPFTDVKLVELFSLRRDIAAKSDLNTSLTVKLVANPAAVTAYNTANGDTFELLPDAIYTLKATPGITKTATGYDFTFSPGEFSKELQINLNGALYDLSKKYAIAFDITDVGGATLTKTTAKSIIVLISIKNKYDGTYTVTGTMSDVTNSTITHVNTALGADAPMQYELRTISATQCAVYDNYVYGGYYSTISSGTSFSQYGNFSAIFTFDPATDKVIAVTNRYGQQAGSQKRSGRLDPTGTNTWVNGTMLIKYNMTQEAALTPALPPPYIRTTWDEEWKYIGPR